MPLEDYIKETVDILQTQPGATEICVQKVYPLRFAAQGGQEQYEQTFKGLNDAMDARHGAILRGGPGPAASSTR